MELFLHSPIRLHDAHRDDFMFYLPTTDLTLCGSMADYLIIWCIVWALTASQHFCFWHWVFSFWFSGLWWHIVSLVEINVSEEHTASFCSLVLASQPSSGNECHCLILVSWPYQGADLLSLLASWPSWGSGWHSLMFIIWSFCGMHWNNLMLASWPSEGTYCHMWC